MIATLRVIALFLAIVLYLSVGWVVGLVFLLMVLITSAVRAATLHRAVHRPLLCEAGHSVPTYGLYTCSVCRFRAASWYGRCPHCSAVFGHVECPTCGRSVANPLTRGWPWG